MLGYALGYTSANDELQQRLNDSEEALKIHVQLAADLVAEQEEQQLQMERLREQLDTAVRDVTEANERAAE